MAIFQAIALLWMTLLSLGLGAIALQFYRIRNRMAVLDLSEQFARIIQRIDADTLRTNVQLRAAVLDAIHCFEDNKILMDKHWGQYHQLKQLAK